MSLGLQLGLDRISREGAYSSGSGAATRVVD